jgi:hypothetical protein
LRKSPAPALAGSRKVSSEWTPPRERQFFSSVNPLQHATSRSSPKANRIDGRASTLKMTSEGRISTSDMAKESSWSRGVQRLVLREKLALAGLEVACGLPVALVNARLLAGFLYGVKPGDPTVLAASIGFLVATAATAGYIPARRASRINPVVALHDE